MSFTVNQQKGNWAEHYVAGQLAGAGCLVRHVTQGHDSGIDLYCEKLGKDSKGRQVPYLHFWCQVKCSSDWNEQPSEIAISRAVFRKNAEEKIWYLLEQPVPVFLIAVPDLRDEANPPFYICRIQDFYPGKRTRQPRDKISSVLKVEKIKKLKNFLSKELPLEVFDWDLMHRKVGPLKQPGYRYIKNMVLGRSPKYESDIRRGAQDLLYTLAQDSRDRERRKAYHLALEIMVLRLQDNHHYYWKQLGIYFEEEEVLEKALEYFRKSLNLINKDVKLELLPVGQREGFMEAKFRLEERIANIESLLGLSVGQSKS